MENKVMDLLKETDAFLEGHFLLSSGKHSNGYVQCAKLLQYPEKASVVCQEIKNKLEKDNVGVDIVVGPAMGGIVIAYELGRTLGVPAIFTERENDEMTLRRGFEIKPGQKVLIVEDVVTTGKSSKETIKVIENHGGEVLGIACLVDRTKNNDIGINLYPAIKIDLDTYDEDDCPLCKENIEIVKPGSRKKFK